MMKTKQSDEKNHRRNDLNGLNGHNNNNNKTSRLAHQTSFKRANAWSNEKIDQALELLEKNSYTLKYTSLKTGIPKEILKYNADLKRVKYKDTEETDLDDDDDDDDDDSATDSEPYQNGNDTDVSTSSSDDETNEQVLIDPPRTLTARKSTSPLKFFMKSFKITSNQRNYASSLSSSSTSETTASIVPFSQRQTKAQKNLQQQVSKQLVPSASESSLDSKQQQQQIPHTNKLIDYILIGPNQDFNLMDVHNFLQNKSKLIEEIEKTVKIYAYLGLRHRYHPVFLNRTLSYMSNHNKKRKSKPKIKTSEKSKEHEQTQRKRLEAKIQELNARLKPKLNSTDLSTNSNRNYEFKFTFNYFQLNNQQFLKELFNESEDNSSQSKANTKTSNKKVNIELYGITNNKSTLIGKCKSELKIDSSNASKTFNTFDNQQSSSKISFKLKELYSYYLIRVYFKKSIQHNEKQPLNANFNDNVETACEPQQQNTKKRKRNGLVHKTSSVNKKSRTNLFVRKEATSIFAETNQHDFYLICTFNLADDRAHENATLVNNLSSIPVQLKEFFKRTIQLRLDKKDEFILEMNHLLYKRERKVLLLHLDLDLSRPNDSDDDGNEQDENESETECFKTESSHNQDETTVARKKRVYNSKNKLAKQDSKTDLSQNCLDGMFFNKTTSYLLRFSVETKVINSETNTNSNRTSPRTANRLNHSNNNTNNINNNNSDDDIIIISPPNSPVSPRKKQQTSSNSASKTSCNKFDDKRLTRSAKSASDLSKKSQTGDNSKANVQIFYQFVKNETNKLDVNSSAASQTNGKISKTNKLTQNTQTNKLMTQKFDYVCPFCQLDCKQLNFLCFHFQMIHFRFHIEEQNTNGLTTNLSQAICNNNYMACSSKDYTEPSSNKRVQFNIRLDENFNGSYLGNPYDHHYAAHLGFSLSRIQPAKRNQVSYVLVNKKSNIFDLSQFKDLTQEEFSVLNIIQQQQQQLNCQMQPNNLYNCQASIERLYYHTQTGQPVHVNEIDYDSDNELDPDWLKQQTNLLIDDFDDVNEGEKDMMRLWNLHNIKFNYVPDCQFYRLCELFIQDQAESMIRKNLFNNFILLLANLFDYGLLNANEMMKLNDLMNEKKTELMAKLNLSCNADSQALQVPIKKPAAHSKRNSLVPRTPDKFTSNHRHNKSFTK